MPDVSNLLENIETPPEEAVKNLEEGKRLGIDPETVAQNSDALKPIMGKQTEVTRSVASQMNENTQKAAAMAPDTEKLNWASKIVNYSGSQIKASDVGRKRAETALRIMQDRAAGKEPNEADLFDIEYLREENERLGKESESLNLDWVSQGIGYIPVALSDTFKDIAAQWETVGATTAVGAVAGPAGAAGGLAVGALAAGAIENAKRFRGEAYDDLSIAKNADGVPLNISEESKRNISLGVAAINTTLELGGDILLAKGSKVLKNLPGLKRILNPTNIRTGNPLTMQAAERLGQLVQGFASEGITEGLQEVVGTYVEKLGQSWDGKETSLIQAMDKTAQELGTAQGIKKVAKATVIGGIAGSGFSVGSQAVDVVHQKVRDKIKTKKSKAIVPEVATETTLPVIDPTPPLPPVEAPRKPTKLNQQEALTFAMSVQGTVDAVNDTAIGKNAPNEAIEVQVKMLQESGVNTVWVAPEELNRWADDQAKAEFIREKFGADSLENVRIGSPVAIDTDIMLQMIRMDGKSIRAFRKDPTAMTVDEVAREYELGQQRAQDALTAAGTAPATEAGEVDAQGVPAPNINQPATFDLGMASTDEDILGALQNRQEANAYLQRLSDEELALTSAEQTDLETPGRLEAIAGMRERVSTLAEGLPEQTEAPASELELSEQEIVDAAFEDFMNEPVLTDLARAGMNDTTRRNLEADYKRVKNEIANSTEEAALKEMTQVRDVIETMADIEETISAIEESVNDPRIDTVETFLANREELRVNPETLTESQRSRYLDDQALVHRKVFAKKGGLSLDEAAQRLNVRPDEFLQILSSVPDLKTATENAIAATEENISMSSAESVEISSAAVIKGLENKQKIDMQIISEIARSSWAKARRYIEGTVFARPNLEQIRIESAARVERTKVSHINSEAFIRGSKIANKRAIKAANRGNFVEASRQMEIQIRNDEMRKQSLITVGKVNRKIKNIAVMMRSPTVQTKLKQAGMESAFAEFSTIINLEPNKKKGVKNKFSALVNRLEGEQITNLMIPEELVQGFDPRAQLKDLSYEQISYIEGKMREMVKLADNTKMQIKEDKIIYNKQIAAVGLAELASNPDFDPKKAKADPIRIGNPFKAAYAKAYGFLEKANASMINIRSITNNISRGDTSSFWHQFLIDQIKGTGAYQNGFGTFATKTWRAKLAKRLQELETKYGKERLDDYGRTWIATPESFKDAVGLLDDKGQIRKKTLLTIAGYYGSATGRNRLKNFKVDVDTLWNFTKENLTEQDFEYVQELQDTFDLLRPQIKRTLEMTSDEDVQWVEGEGFEVNGKWYRGGYIPLYYQRNFSIEEQNKINRESTDEALGKSKTLPLDISVTKAFTKQGHLETRAKDGRLVLQTDIAMIVSQGLEQVITDTTMYVPIANIMNTLNMDDVAVGMASVIGKVDLQVLKNHVIDAGKSVNVERIQNFQDIEKFNSNLLSRIAGYITANQLLVVPTVAMNQLASGFYMWREGGLGSTGTYLNIAMKTMLNPKAAMDLAAQITPSIGDFRSGIDERTFGALYESLPQDAYQFKPAQKLSEINESIRNFNFDLVLGTIDAMLKTNVTLTLQARFLEGKVAGFDEEVLAKMTDEQRQNAMKSYVSDVVDRTGTASEQIDKSFIQKSPKLKPWAVYFNDVRNVYNYTSFNVREWKRDTKDAIKSIKSGDYKKSISLLADAGTSFATYQLFNAMMIGFMNSVRGRDDEGKEMQGILSMKWEEVMAEDFFNNLFNPIAFADTAANSVPIVREIRFAWQARDASNGRWKPSVMPMELRALNNVMEGIYALNQFRVNGKMNKAEKRQVMSFLGTVIPVFPSNAFNKLMKESSYKDDAFSDPGLILSAPLLIYDLISSGELEVAPNSADAAMLEEIKTQIDPTNSAAIKMIREGDMAVMTDNEWDTIKMIESNNDPSAYNEASGAAGSFQFTERTWNELRRSHPQLGLTEDGRFDAEQSDTAMTQLSMNNAITLLRKKVPVNIDTLYTAHHFGDKRAAKIWKLDDNAPLDGLITPEFREANPWLDGFGGYVRGNRVENNYGITERVVTAGDFKEAIRKIIQYGQDAVAFEAELKGN